MTDLEIKKSLNQYVETLRGKDKEFDKFFSLIEKESETFYILGGLLRNLYFEEKNNIRDIDIITKNLNLKNLEKFKHKKNRFGSYKFIFNFIDIDLWDFKDNWGYKNNIIKNQGTLKEISKGTLFNIDSLVMDYKRQIIEKRLFEQIKRSKRIDFTIRNKRMIKANPCPEINILRILINSEKYKLKISKEVKKYIYDYLEKDFYIKLEKIYQSQFKHYNQEKIKMCELKYKLKKLEKRKKFHNNGGIKNDNKI